MNKTLAFYVSFVVATLAIAVNAFGANSNNPSSATVLRISLDTGPNHVRTIVVRRFADNLAAELPGRFEVKIFDSGQLHTDRDVIKGLLWGDVELALPTTLQLARFEPSANVTSLPMFYGQPLNVIHNVLDGELGKAIAEQVEGHLPVKVLIPNLDLGYVNLFSTETPLQHTKEVDGLKVRVPGGLGNIQRLRLQGAYPIAIPWSDVPLALSQGNIDAVATTFETLQSGSLWEVGIRYGFEERGMFLQYVPILRQQFWDQMDGPTREEFLRIWLDTMHEARIFAQNRQVIARKMAIEHGVSVATPSGAEILDERRRLQDHHDKLVKMLRIPPHIVTIAQRHITEKRQTQAENTGE